MRDILAAMLKHAACAAFAIAFFQASAFTQRTESAAPVPFTASEVSSAASKSQSTEVRLRIAAEVNSQPKWTQEADGHGAYCSALMAALHAYDGRLVFALDPTARPQRRLELELTNGQLDLICGLTRIPAREAQAVYLEPPLFRAEYVLVARSDDPIEIHDWNEVRALGSHGVILLNHDSSRISVLEDLGGLHLMPRGVDTESSLRMLAAGRGRFFYFPRANALAAIHAMGMDNRFRALLPALQTEPYYLLAGRHVPEPLRRRLQQALDHLARTGQLARLEAQWMRPAPR